MLQLITLENAWEMAVFFCMEATSTEAHVTWLDCMHSWNACLSCLKMLPNTLTSEVCISSDSRWFTLWCEGCVNLENREHQLRNGVVIIMKHSKLEWNNNSGIRRSHPNHCHKVQTNIWWQFYKAECPEAILLVCWCVFCFLRLKC